MWGTYIVTILAEDRPTIRAMNPTTWIKHTSYPDLDFGPSFRAFAKQWAELLALLRTLPTAAWSRTALVTGAGRPRERTIYAPKHLVLSTTRAAARLLANQVIDTTAIDDCTQKQAQKGHHHEHQSQHQPDRTL